MINRTVARARAIALLLGYAAIALVLEAGKRWGD
jgi:hypothetical protein